MGCCQEGFRAAEGAQAELSPVFEAIEHALHNVARFVEFDVIFELYLAVLSRGDAGGCLDLSEPIAQVICVMATVCNDCASFGDIWLKALTRMRNIGSVACCQMQMNRASSPITNQMQLRIQSAFGFVDAAPVAVVFLTPLAAIRWVLTWLASIMSVDNSAVSRASAANTRAKTPASDHLFQRL